MPDNRNTYALRRVEIVPLQTVFTGEAESRGFDFTRDIGRVERIEQNMSSNYTYGGYLIMHLKDGNKIAHYNGEKESGSLETFVDTHIDEITGSIADIKVMGTGVSGRPLFPDSDNNTSTLGQCALAFKAHHEADPDLSANRKLPESHASGLYLNMGA